MKGTAPVEQGRRSRLVRGVSALVLVAMTTAGVVALSGGITERKNATALAASDSVFIGAVGTVTADAGHTGWSQMPVQFDTTDGTSVETMVWTRQGNRDFDAGQRVDLEYVSQHPEAARLAGDQGGPAKSWQTIAVGVTILTGSLVLAAAWTWDVATSRRRRRA